LEAPTEFPNVLANVWTAFCALNNTRGQGFSGPNPITYTEIRDYKELTETPLAPREVELLKHLDAVYMRTTNG